MSSLYTDILMDAYRNPSHRGEIAHPTHSHEEENPLCGDTLRVHLRIEDDCIAQAGFEGRGCVISQAAAELMLERIERQPTSVVQELNRDTVLSELGLQSISPARLKCALLVVEALKRALPVVRVE